jgi:uncharacterized membrane protein YkoI
MTKWAHFSLVLLSVAALNGAAADEEQHDYAEDHERARILSQQGLILPLETLLIEVQAHYPQAHILDVELEDEDGLYYYEIELLTAQGEVLELEIDATSGTLLAVEKD